MNDWLERHRTLVLSAVGLLLTSAVGLYAVKWQPAPEMVIEPPPPTLTPEPSPIPGPITVYVSGAVRSPSVVELPYDAIVQDAIAAVGGTVGDADLTRINLARPLQNGEQVHIPAAGEAIPTQASDGDSPTPTPLGPINLNTATLAELEWLPGIGPALAQRIIDYRETVGAFTSIEQIQNVSGIGPRTYEGLKDLIIVDE